MLSQVFSEYSIFEKYSWTSLLKTCKYYTFPKTSIYNIS